MLLSRSLQLGLLGLTAVVYGASMRLPSYPLAVKTPYLSVWMPGNIAHDFPSATPQFWQGQDLTWTVLIRIETSTFCLMGCTHDAYDAVQKAHQTSINFTSTHTYVSFEAGSHECTLDFFSPVDPLDHVRQSLPYSYLTVSTTSNTTIDVLTAIDETWLYTRGRPHAQSMATDHAVLLALNGDQERDFSEFNDMALWGDVVLAASITSGTSTSCRYDGRRSVVKSFVETGDLGGEFQGIGERIAACAQGGSKTGVTFAVGLQQAEEIQYFDGKTTTSQVGYFKTKVSTVSEAVNHFFDDFASASAQSRELDKQVRRLGLATSSNYSDLLEFSVRQSFGGMQVTISSDTMDTSTPYAFIKEISTDGNVNTLADLIPKALPIFHILNPEYTRMFLEPVLRFSKVAWPLKHAVHDIGKRYPNATGERPCIEEFLPLDSSTVLIWMLYLYQRTTGKSDMTRTYAQILRRYADYCVNYGLYPVLQRSSVDQIGSAANQSALSMSAAIALNAYGKMTGQSNYSDKGLEYARIITDIATDRNGTHFLAHYGDRDESFVMTYPLAFDALMGLNTFPRHIHDNQSEYFLSQAHPFGVQFNSNIKYTLMEFSIWVAAISSAKLRAHLVDAVHMFLNQETDATGSVPGPSQWRVVPGVDEGKWTRFSKAKSVVGSVFMIAAVENQALSGPAGAHENKASTLALPPESGTFDRVDLPFVLQEQLPFESQPVGLDIPFTVPLGASEPVNSAFLGLSFDTASLPVYMGNLSVPNALSRSLIHDLMRASDVKLTIRVGSAAGDYAVYDSRQGSAIITHDDAGRDVLSLGPSYFDSIRVLDSEKNIQWIYQVPFANLNITNALESVKQATDAIALRRLFALEIGHEPNLYAGISRSENYGCQSYAAELFKFKVAMRRNIARVARKFQALGLSTGHLDPAWSVEECFSSGIYAQEDLGSLSMHYSQLSSHDELNLDKIPRHSDIQKRYKDLLPQVQYTRDIYPCFPFVLSEASLVSPTAQDKQLDCLNEDGSASLEIALWNLDFLLYSMSKNVSRVLMQQSCDSVSSAWIPSACHGNASSATDSSEVKAPFYALSFVSYFLNGAQDFRVVPIVESDETVIYAAYEIERLSKLAVVNRPSTREEHLVNPQHEELQLRLPSEVVGLRASSRMDMMTIKSGMQESKENLWFGRSLIQAPLSEHTTALYSMHEGVLSLDTSRSGAVLLDVRY